MKILLFALTLALLSPTVFAEKIGKWELGGQFVKTDERVIKEGRDGVKVYQCDSVNRFESAMVITDGKNIVQTIVFTKNWTMDIHRLELVKQKGNKFYRDIKNILKNKYPGLGDKTDRKIMNDGFGNTAMWMSPFQQSSGLEGINSKTLGMLLLDIEGDGGDLVTTPRKVKCSLMYVSQEWYKNQKAKQAKQDEGF